MEDTRKASKSLNPEEGISLTVRIRVSAFTILITHSIFTQKLPEREGIQKPPPLANNSGLNYGRGFHLFGFWSIRLIGFSQQTAELVRMDVLFTEKHLCPITDSRTECRIIQNAYFFHRITSVTNQTHFRIYKHVSKGRDLFFEMFWNIFSSSKTQQL